MTLSIFLQFVIVLAAIWMGARYSGVGLGLWGAVGLLVLVAAFGVTPTSPPIDVMLIILAVIMAASVMDAAGGIDFLVRIAERIIRANPKYVTIVAPLTTWSFTFVAGTGHIVYPLLPVIYETAHQSGIRPERPMAAATIASQQAITASPVAAATAAMIGLFSEKGLTQWGLPEILMVCVPATLTGVVAAAIVSMFIGKDLKDDPEYQARLKAGKIPRSAPGIVPHLEKDVQLTLGELQGSGVDGHFFLHPVNSIAVEDSLVGEGLIQENRFLASLSDRKSDGPEPPLSVLCGEHQLLSLGNVLGKRLKARRRNFALIHESEEPSYGTQDDQEKYEPNP